jgi:SPP1 gp7 family putative phage head morphogenesis protein
MTSAEVTALEDMLAYWQEKMYFKTPSVYDAANAEWVPKIKFMLHERQSTSTEVFEETIKQLNTDMKRALLIPDNLGFSDIRTGSLAQSKTELEVFSMVLRDIHGKLEDFINPTLRQIERINFGEIDNPCEWKFNDIDKRIEKELIKILVEQGVIDPNEKWIRQWVGIPEITIEEQEELEQKKLDNQLKQQAIMKSQKEEPDGEDKDESEGFQSEKRGKPNTRKIEKNLNSLETNFISVYDRVHKKNSEKLEKQVIENYKLEKKNYRWIESLTINKSIVNRAVAIYYARLYFQGKKDALDEIVTRVDIKETLQEDIISDELSEQWLKNEYIRQQLRDEKYGKLGLLTSEDVKELNGFKQKAFLVSGAENERMRKAISSLIAESLDLDRPLKDVIPMIQQRLNEDLKKYALTIARTNAVSAYNAGQLNTYMSKTIRPLIDAFEYVAVIDDKTTLFCTAHNEQIIKKGDPQLGLMWPPNHFNCRSILNPIFIGDDKDPDNYYYEYETKFKPFGDGITNNKAKLPEKNFGT